jgi:hypothetical protein
LARDHRDNRGYKRGPKKFRDAEQTQFGKRGFDGHENENDHEDLQKHERNREQHFAQTESLSQSPRRDKYVEKNADEDEKLHGARPFR